MSEPIPESIPTSADPRSKRPVKKRALTPVSKHASNVDALFANPDREIKIPTGPQEKTLAPPPEIVTNVQGSSAGAGSGEFHVYKASRRREHERVRLMEEASEKEKQALEWEQKQTELKEKSQKKLNKNQARRAKARQNKERAKDKDKGTLDEESEGAASRAVKPKPSRPKDQQSANGDESATIQNGHTAEDLPGIVIHDED